MLHFVTVRVWVCFGNVCVRFHLPIHLLIDSLIISGILVSHFRTIFIRHRVPYSAVGGLFTFDASSRLKYLPHYWPLCDILLLLSLGPEGGELFALILFIIVP